MKKTKLLSLVISAAMVMSLTTTYDVSNVHAEELTQTLTCEKEEHTHTEDCYTKVLICEQEESEEHTHTDDCYETTLTCDLEEHTHTEECYKTTDPEPEASPSAENTPEIIYTVDEENEEEQPEEKSALASAEELFAALPDASSITEDNRDAIYAQMQTALDAYDALSAEDQELFNLELLAKGYALADYFNGGIELLDESNPLNIKLNGNIIRWDEYPGASEYDLSISIYEKDNLENRITTTGGSSNTNQYDLSRNNVLGQLLSTGVSYTLEINVKPSSLHYWLSSSQYNYTFALTPVSITNVHWQGLKLVCDKNENVASYTFELKISEPGRWETVATKTQTSNICDFSEEIKAEGEHNYYYYIEAYPSANNSTYMVNSYSGDARIDPATAVDPNPLNVQLNGNIITWNTCEGANEYDLSLTFYKKDTGELLFNYGTDLNANRFDISQRNMITESLSIGTTYTIQVSVKPSNSTDWVYITYEYTYNLSVPSPAPSPEQPKESVTAANQTGNTTVTDNNNISDETGSDIVPSATPLLQSANYTEKQLHTWPEITKAIQNLKPGELAADVATKTQTFIVDASKTGKYVGKDVIKALDQKENLNFHILMGNGDAVTFQSNTDNSKYTGTNFTVTSTTSNSGTSKQRKIAFIHPGIIGTTVQFHIHLDKTAAGKTASVYTVDKKGNRTLLTTATIAENGNICIPISEKQTLEIIY